MLRWLRADPDLCSQTAGTADLIRVYDAAGNVIDSALPVSMGNRGAILMFANRSEITAHLDIPSCQYIVSVGIWPRFHISSSCAFS